MDWKRVKTILIFLLLVTNIVLAASIYSQFSARNSAERQAIRAAIELVKDTLTLSESDILALPRESYTLRVARANELEDAFAQKLLGEEFTTESGGGGIYRYTGRNGSGEIKRGGEIAFVLKPEFGDAEPGDYFARLLAGAGLSLNGGASGPEGWSFEQYYAGYPILGYELVCSQQGIDGRWLISDSWTRHEAAPTRAELVVRLAAAASELGFQSVDSLRCGYYVENTGGQDSLAVPVWLVDAGGETIVFNLMSGRALE